MTMFGKIVDRWPWIFWSLIVTLLLAVVFGYFDSELAEGRRLMGCGLIVVGVGVAVRAVWRLADDWPRAKPQHSFDLCFLEVVLGVFVLSAAFLISSRTDAMIARFDQPLPNLSDFKAWVTGSPSSP